MTNRVIVEERTNQIVINGRERVLVPKPEVRIVTKGEQGPPGSTAVNYIAIRTATYTVRPDELIPGINIFGVNYAGEVTIYLPPNLPSNRLLTVKDEGGSASVYPITLQTT